MRFVSVDYKRPTHGVAIKRNIASHGFIGLSSAEQGSSLRRVYTSTGPADTSTYQTIPVTFIPYAGRYVYCVNHKSAKISLYL